MPKLNEAQKAEIRAAFEEERRLYGRAYGLGPKLAEKYGVPAKDIYNAASYTPKGVTPTSDEFDDPAFSVKGTSTLYNAEGKLVAKWVKTTKDNTADAARQVFEGFLADLPKLPPKKAEGKDYAKDLLSVIPFGDPHIGMHAWGEETGADFDLKIAERDLCAAVDRLVSIGPDAEQCLIANLGDFFHADNMDAKTWRSGHNLDVDSRWAKVLRVGLQAMRQCIESALSKHKTVTVINAIGNHDDHSSMFLTIALKHIYEKEPRVVIDDAPTIKHYYHFGKVLIGVHHGHSIKMRELAAQMPHDRKKEFYESEHYYWLTGHIHHDSRKEYDGILVESFRTLAARDAYAASHGYRSGRDMKLLVMHREFGEIARHTVSVEMLMRGYGKKELSAGR